MKIKSLSILLATLILSVSMLASCSNPSDSEESGTSSADSVGLTDTVVEEDTKVPLELPEMSFTDKTLTFLTRSEGEWTTVEIFSEGMTSQTDNINNAVFERNMLIKDKYGADIQEIKKFTGEHIAMVQREVSAPTGDYTALISSIGQTVSLASQSYLLNLKADEIEYMDVTNPWWDTNMAEGLSVNDQLFFATGDLMTLDNDATFVILFNKKLANDHQVSNPYSLVENKEWTLDKFYELIQKCVRDNDGNGTLEYDSDVCGLAYTEDAPCCVLFGSGITLVQKDENGTPEYNLNVEKAQNISEMGKRIFAKSASVDMNAAAKDGPSMMQIGQTTFGENHALFFAECMQSVTRMRSYDVDFGILPFPMYDEQQDNYYSMMHNTATVVSIPKCVTGVKLELTNYIIEAMAYYSVDTLTEQYYDINLKTKGAKDVESGPMIDMILANRVCDLAYYYRWGNNGFKSLGETLLPDSTSSVSSLNTVIKRAMGRDIPNFLNNLD